MDYKQEYSYEKSGSFEDTATVSIQIHLLVSE